MTNAQATAALYLHLNGYLRLPDRRRPAAEEIGDRGSTVADWFIRNTAVVLLLRLDAFMAVDPSAGTLPLWWNPIRVTRFQQTLSGDETRLGMQVITTIGTERIVVNAFATKIGNRVHINFYQNGHLSYPIDELVRANASVDSANPFRHAAPTAHHGHARSHH